jgi:hypothetical protein
MGGDPSLADFSNYTNDINLLYELEVLFAVDPERASRLVRSPWIYARNARPIPQSTRMQLLRVSEDSPLELEVAVPLLTSAGIAAAAIWATVQSLLEIYNVPLDRRIKEAEARLKEIEVARAEDAYLDAQEERAIRGRVVTEGDYRQRDARQAVRRRLIRSRYRMTRIDVEIDD